MKTVVMLVMLAAAATGGTVERSVLGMELVPAEETPGLARTRADEFRQLVISTSVVQGYLLTYGFMVGSGIAGNMIRDGRSTASATASWAALSLGVGGLGWWATESALRQFARDRGSDDPDRPDGEVESYRMLWMGTGVGSITDFHAASTRIGESGSPRPGQPLWTATAEDVKTTDSLPSMGVRIGRWHRRWGADMSVSLSSYHTTPQTVYYDAQGVIQTPIGYVPAKLGAVELPNRFLLLRSVAYGGNAYLRLPGRGIQPYLGLGGALLVNSAQSEYAGPASLKNQGDKLALDTLSLGWQLQLTVGARLPLAHGRFLFAEFRPARSWMAYDSGGYDFPEHDRLVLQTFAAQAGIGFRFN